MGFFDDLLKETSLETSRHHTTHDVNPYYIYLMQDEYDSIIAIYKVPYNQSDNGGWRFRDFISENIKDEQKTVPAPDYIFRSYYIPQGSVLPDVKRDNLETFRKLLEQPQLGILEKEISFKQAAYAVFCKQPYFHSDGTAFDGRSYNPSGWNEYLQKDSRNAILKKSEELKSSAEYSFGSESTEKQRSDYLAQFNALIINANDIQGLVPRIYDNLYNQSWGITRNETARSLKSMLFPAFFFTNYGSHKWTDKDMMQFICQTGMDAIKHIKNCPSMDQFFKRHGMTDSVSRYNRNIDSLKTGISIGSGVGEGPASWEKARLLAVEDIKRYCNAFLNGTVSPLHVPRQSEPLRTSPNESNWSNIEEQVSFTPTIKY